MTFLLGSVTVIEAGEHVHTDAPCACILVGSDLVFGGLGQKLIRRSSGQTEEYGNHLKVFIVRHEGCNEMEIYVLGVDALEANEERFHGESMSEDTFFLRGRGLPAIKEGEKPGPSFGQVMCYKPVGRRGGIILESVIASHGYLAEIFGDELERWVTFAFGYRSQVDKWAIRGVHQGCGCPHVGIQWVLGHVK